MPQPTRIIIPFQHDLMGAVLDAVPQGFCDGFEQECREAGFGVRHMGVAGDSVSGMAHVRTGDVVMLTTGNPLLATARSALADLTARGVMVCTNDVDLLRGGAAFGYQVHTIEYAQQLAYLLFLLGKGWLPHKLQGEDVVETCVVTVNRAALRSHGIECPQGLADEIGVQMIDEP
jgi:hypothetical protein